MLLKKLVEPLTSFRLRGDDNVSVSGLSYDSRAVERGQAFVAIEGLKLDGHDFVPEAVSRGATAIVAQKDLETPPDVALVLVPDSRLALAQLSAHFFDYPSRRVRLFGVTGTNGKTTTTYLIENILRASGLKTGVIGTLGIRIGDELLRTEHTTPESLDLQRILAQMVENGVTAAAMEVSSHGLALRRTDCCEFDCGIFTNLTQDHMDFHAGFEDYLAAKLRLFSEYPAHSSKAFTAAVNADDPYGERVAAAVRGKALTYGIESAADVRATDVQVSASGSRFLLRWKHGTQEIDLPLGGLFNVYNALAAAAAALTQGLSADHVRAGLESARSVPGRFESVDCGQNFGVVVDYAHTPDGLENVLRSARKITRGRLIAVFGCGGDRDRGKRPKMGAIGAREADVCVITSDNPRTEDPEEIIRQIMAGIRDDALGRVVIEPDRRRAISEAIGMANEGDTVVIAGKGHETEQVFGDRRVPFDDRAVAREELTRLTARRRQVTCGDRRQ